MIIKIEEVKNKINELIGMNVSLAWKGYGSTIFIELGILTKEKTTRSFHANGEACIWLEWDWRIEKDGKILFGSSNSRPEIEEGINKLVGKKIEKIELTGSIPELTIGFSDGYIINTMAMISGDPQWSIRLKDSTYLSWEDLNGMVKKGDETGPDETIEEKEYTDFIDNITERIGKPIEEPISGYCSSCKYFFSIDGDFALLDYGVCLNKDSKFDQNVVKTDSGCSVFLLDE